MAKAKAKAKKKETGKGKAKAKAKGKGKAETKTGVLGLRSVIYKVSDLARAKEFYGALLARAPYFDQPYYVGYDVDGDELGLDPDISNVQPGGGGAHAYWRVGDISAAWEHAISHGAGPVEPPHNVGEGTDVALVTDPFGNYVGLIQIAN